MADTAEPFDFEALQQDLDELKRLDNLLAIVRSLKPQEKEEDDG